MLLSIFMFQTCTQPKATVFRDDRLAQEEIVKFCLLGDMGLGSDHQKAIAISLEKENCHRIVFLGDLIYPKGISSSEDPELENKFMNYYLPLFERNPDLVILLLLGNHDHQGKASAWKDVYKMDDRFFFPNYYYFVDYGGLCLVALDTSFYFYKNEIPEAVSQSRWLSSIQSMLKKCDVKIALSHHPYKGGGYSGSKDWEGAGGALKIFLDTFVIGNFDLHIAGHVHIFADDGKDEKTRMLISGTGGENRGDGRSGYVILNWVPTNPKRIVYRLKYVDIEPYIFSDDIQEEKEEFIYDELIKKDFLEEGLWARVVGWFMKFYN